MRHQLRPFTRLALFSLCLILPSSCLSEAETATGVPFPVRVVRPALLSSEETIQAGGSLIPRRELNLSSTGTGRLVYCPLREGDDFVRGQLLARLENPSLNLERARAQRSLERSQAALALSAQALFDLRSTLEKRVASLEKQKAERALALRRVQEGARKLRDSEALHEEGALSLETLRVARHEQACLEEQLEIIDLALDESSVGLRLCDLEAAGLLPEDHHGPALEPCSLERGSVLFEAFVRLHSRSLASEHDAARSLCDAARIDVEAVELALGELSLYAPFDGRVLSREAVEGMLISAGTGLVSIMENNDMDVVFRVGEREGRILARGMVADIHIPSLSYDGKGLLERIAALADSTSASLSARVAMGESPPGARPGLFARISIVLPREEEQLVVDRRALRRLTAGSALCFEIIADQVFERVLRTGESIESGIVILEGLSGDELLVLDPSGSLKGGDRVVCID